MACSDFTEDFTHMHRHLSTFPKSKKASIERLIVPGLISHVPSTSIVLIVLIYPIRTRSNKYILSLTVSKVY